MRSFVEWLEQETFWVRDSYDFAESNPKKGWKGPGKLVLAPFQRRILEHCLTPDEDGVLPYQNITYSTIKKSGKTALAAAITMWYAEEVATPGSEIYMLANNEEQAKARAFNDLLYHAEWRNQQASEEGIPKWKVTMNRITLTNGTFILAVPNNYTSSAGSRHALTVWDELWGFNSELDRRLWEEMTPIPTVKNGLRLVVTYAGIYGESQLLWDLYRATVGKEEFEDGLADYIDELDPLPCYRTHNSFTYWDHDPRMPWQTEEYYTEQKLTLRPAAYFRLHENRWVQSAESFIPIDWWDECLIPEHAPLSVLPASPWRGSVMVIGVDASSKHDCTAAVCVCYDSVMQKTILLDHKIWTPEKKEDFDLDETVGKWVWEMHRKYIIHKVCYDPTQLHSIMITLKKKGVQVEEFPQQGQMMITATQALYDALKYHRLVVYDTEDLRAHVRDVVVEEGPRGFRLSKVSRKDKSKDKAVDGAVALAMAVHTAIANMSVVRDEPVRMQAAFSDMTAWRVPDPSEFKLPWQLRN